ncbi:flavodoxin family protein [bacterium]|nr:flavodoxin family protein [bacterium]MBQ9149495.1 flavodoxin family protein [bacterium]
MKILLFNGSPHKEGCTYTALAEIAKTLKEEEIDSEIFHVGNEPVASCKACRACANIGKCIINDKVNEFVELMSNCDGLIIGSPVHYASSSGASVSFLDRAFFSAFMAGRGEIFEHKPASAIVSARRAGTTTTLDQLNKYFTITQMPIISGRYWNMVHGATSDEVKQDLEGMQNMRIVARNIAWHLKCKEVATKAGIKPPQKEEVIYTNFIR